MNRIRRILGLSSAPLRPSAVFAAAVLLLGVMVLVGSSRPSRAARADSKPASIPSRLNESTGEHLFRITLASMSPPDSVRFSSLLHLSDSYARLSDLNMVASCKFDDLVMRLEPVLMLPVLG